MAEDTAAGGQYDDGETDDLDKQIEDVLQQLEDAEADRETAAQEVQRTLLVRSERFQMQAEFHMNFALAALGAAVIENYLQGGASDTMFLLLSVFCVFSNMLLAHALLAEKGRH